MAWNVIIAGGGFGGFYAARSLDGTEEPLRYDQLIVALGSVSRTLTIPGLCAAVPDPAREGQPCPPTAQHAVRQGRVVGRTADGG